MQIYRSNPPSRNVRPRAVPIVAEDGVGRMVNPAPSTANLLREIRQYINANPGLSDSAFGRIAMQDPGFVSRVAAGATLRDETIRRARKFMLENGHA